MKIGILHTAYNSESYVNRCLSPWTYLRSNSEHEFIISSVCVPFLEYKDANIKPDKTLYKILDLLDDRRIDFVASEPQFVQESQARNLALLPLLNKNIDILWILDNDEFYTVNQIEKIIDYINSLPKEVFFEINFKNIILDGRHWLSGFHPPRIFRNNVHGGIGGFYWDNDIVFKDGTIYKKFQGNTIPIDVAHVVHYTWLNENGKDKVEYHKKHFGDCSYKWNEERQQLEVDFEYYIRMGYETPQIHKI